MGRIWLAALWMAGCASRPEDYRLGPWRQVALPIRAWVLSPDDADPDVLHVAGDGRLLRVRIADGSVLREASVPVRQEGLASCRGRVYAQSERSILVLTDGAVEEEIPTPADADEGISVDRRNGALFVSARDALWRRDARDRTWRSLGRASSPLGWIAPRVSSGTVYGRSGLYREGEGFRSYRARDPCQGVFGAWESRSDPSFVLLAAYPRSVASGDGGRTGEAIAADVSYLLHPCGYEFRGGRLLFFESNGGKMSLGRTWGTSTLWVSRDDGRTVSKVGAMPQVAIAMAVAGNHLAFVDQRGRLWVAAITRD